MVGQVLYVRRDSHPASHTGTPSDSFRGWVRTESPTGVGLAIGFAIGGVRGCPTLVPYQDICRPSSGSTPGLSASTRSAPTEAAKKAVTATDTQ